MLDWLGQLFPGTATADKPASIDQRASEKHPCFSKESVGPCSTPPQSVYLILQGRITHPEHQTPDRSM